MNSKLYQLLKKANLTDYLDLAEEFENNLAFYSIYNNDLVVELLKTTKEAISNIIK